MRACKLVRGVTRGQLQPRGAARSSCRRDERSPRDHELRRRQKSRESGAVLRDQRFQMICLVQAGGRCGQEYDWPRPLKRPEPAPIRVSRKVDASPQHPTNVRTGPPSPAHDAQARRTDCLRTRRGSWSASTPSAKPVPHAGATVDWFWGEVRSGVTRHACDRREASQNFVVASESRPSPLETFARRCDSDVSQDGCRESALLLVCVSGLHDARERDEASQSRAGERERERETRSFEKSLHTKSH